MIEKISYNAPMGEVLVQVAAKLNEIVEAINTKKSESSIKLFEYRRAIINNYCDRLLYFVENEFEDVPYSNEAKHIISELRSWL